MKPGRYTEPQILPQKHGPLSFVVWMLVSFTMGTHHFVSCMLLYFVLFYTNVHISIYERFMDELYGSLCTLYFALCLFTLHVYYMTGDVLHDFSFLFFSFGMSFLVIACSYECSCLFLRCYIILLYIILH